MAKALSNIAFKNLLYFAFFFYCGILYIVRGLSSISLYVYVILFYIVWLNVWYHKRLNKTHLISDIVREGGLLDF